MSEPIKSAKKLNLPEMGIFAKGIVTLIGKTKKNQPKYSIAVGASMVTLFTETHYEKGEIIEILIRPFEANLMVTEAN